MKAISKNCFDLALFFVHTSITHLIAEVHHCVPRVEPRMHLYQIDLFKFAAVIACLDLMIWLSVKMVLDSDLL